MKANAFNTGAIKPFSTVDFSVMGQTYSTSVYGQTSSADTALLIPVAETLCLDARETKSMTEAIQKLPGTTEALHMIIGASHSMGQVIHAILNLSNTTIDTLYIARCHAKIIAAKLHNGQTITAEGSANTRSCKTIENVTLYGSPDVYSFHAGWMDALFLGAK
jgi:hypothetical protein